MAVIEAGLQSADSGRRVRPDFTEAEREAWAEAGRIVSVSQVGWQRSVHT